MLSKHQGKKLSKDDVFQMNYNTGGCNTPTSPKTIEIKKDQEEEEDYDFSSAEDISKDKAV